MNNIIEKYEEEKWIIEEYIWGVIGKLKQDFRNEKSELKYLKEDYWPIAVSNKWRVSANSKTEQDIDFELKYWEFNKNIKKDHFPKIQRNATEYNFILKGEIVGEISNNKGESKSDIILKTGDFIVIRPGFLINLEKIIIEDTKGITIKIPGIKNDDFKIKNY